jgi:hypothetical protein
MKNPDRPICGAKNREGNPCRRSPLAGKQRCRLHGGATPAGRSVGASNGNHKGGLYGAYLSPQEAAAWDALPLGDVDHEIRMCRVWLARALALEMATARPTNADGTELAEVRHSVSDEAGISRTDVVNKRPDVAARIDRLLGRLAQLERTRAELIQAAQAAGDGADDKARDLIQVIHAIRRVEQVDPEPDDEPEPAVDD